ncbi:MAG: hypothetical protein RL591_947 [Planctomycetota bacterium]
MADRQDNLETNGDGHEEPVRGASHDHAAAHAADGLPRQAGDDFDVLMRELDRVGRSHRARLSQEAEERIFAASDLQLPLAADAVSPVVGRIGGHIGGLVSGKTVSGKTVSGKTVSGKTVSGSAAASRARSIPRTMPWLRVAAAIAVVGGVAALAVVFARSTVTDQPMAPGEVLVDGRSADPSTSSNANASASSSASGSASGSSPSGSPTTRADDVLARVPTSEHFERALVDLHPSRSSAMPERAIVVALSEPRRLAYQSAALESLDTKAARAMRNTGSGEDVSLAFATLSLSAGDDGDLDLDFDALSGEFAAIVSQSAALR